jgi:hypothetical protein
MIQHNESDIFNLNESEWNEAIIAYPNLLEKDPILNFLSRSANAWIEPKKDHYFSNEVILRQFER